MYFLTIQTEKGIFYIGMKRRDFFKYAALFSGGFAFNDYRNINTPSLELKKSRIVIAKNDNIRKSKKTLDFNRVNELLARAVKSFFNVSKHSEGWKKIIPSRAKVGLKINCLAGKGGASTQIELTESIVRQLVDSGFRENDIIVWDRLSSDLKSAGYTIRTGGNGYRCYGNDHGGYERELRIHRSVGSLFSKILTNQCDVIINIPVLKDHGICGYTGALKNMFGVIHNPNKYHDYTGNPYIADLYDYPMIKKKTVITIMDAINIQYNGGPPYFPKWSFPYNGIIIGTDPLALDIVGLNIIENFRNKFNLPSLKSENRDPVYLKTAAEIGIGEGDIKNIEQIKV